MADIKIAYPSASSSAVTITLASLGSGSQGVFTTGQASLAVTNEATLDLDHILSGRITVGATGITASRSINVYVVAPRSMASGTATWPDVITGADLGRTFTSVNVMNSIVKLAASMTIDITTNRSYEFGGVSVAALFGGTLPPEYVVYVAHDTGGPLHATAGNHEINYFRVQGQSV
jgi:hypothetical protein